MPNEKVKFLKQIDEIEEKIVYVKDKDLLGFDSANNPAFLFNMYKMEKFGVSKNFIYMDDDYFIGKSLKKSDFFYYNEKKKIVVPYIISNIFYEMNKTFILKRYNELFQKKDYFQPHSSKAFWLQTYSGEKFFFDHYNCSLIYTEFTHNAIPENINELKEIFEESKKYTISSKRVRNKTPDINLLNDDYSNNDNIVFNSDKNSINSSRIYINKNNNINYNYFKFPLFNEDKVQKKEKYLSKLKEDYKNRKVEEKITNSLKQQMHIKKKAEMNIINDTIKYKNKSLIQEYLMPPNQIYDIIPPKAHYLYHNKTGF